MRGYQKKVIYLKDTGSHLFEEAYFVVSRKGEEANIEQSDMVFEANRIIKDTSNSPPSRTSKSDCGYSFFFRWAIVI